MAGLRTLVLAGILLVAIAIIVDTAEGKKHKKGGGRYKNHENKKDGIEKRYEGKATEKNKKEKYGGKKERKNHNAETVGEPPASEENILAKESKHGKKESKMKKGKIAQESPKNDRVGDSKKVKRSVDKEEKLDKKKEALTEVDIASSENVPACDGGAGTKENYKIPSDEDVCRKCAEEKAKEAAGVEIQIPVDIVEDTSEVEVETDDSKVN